MITIFIPESGQLDQFQQTNKQDRLLGQKRSTVARITTKIFEDFDERFFLLKASKSVMNIDLTH